MANTVHCPFYPFSFKSSLITEPWFCLKWYCAQLKNKPINKTHFLRCKQQPAGKILVSETVVTSASLLYSFYLEHECSSWSCSSLNVTLMMKTLLEETQISHLCDKDVTSEHLYQLWLTSRLLGLLLYSQCNPHYDGFHYDWKKKVLEIIESFNL